MPTVTTPTERLAPGARRGRAAGAASATAEGLPALDLATRRRRTAATGAAPGAGEPPRLAERPGPAAAGPGRAVPAETTGAGGGATVGEAGRAPGSGAEVGRAPDSGVGRQGVSTTLVGVGERDVPTILADVGERHTSTRLAGAGERDVSSTLAASAPEGSWGEEPSTTPAEGETPQREDVTQMPSLTLQTRRTTATEAGPERGERSAPGPGSPGTGETPDSQFPPDHPASSSTGTQPAGREPRPGRDSSGAGQPGAARERAERSDLEEVFFEGSGGLPAYDADVDRLVENLYREIERRMRIERERRGL